MNLLITGAWQQANEYIPEIEKKHQVKFIQCEKDELPCASTWVEGIICNSLFLYHPIERFTNLRYIQLTSAGFDRVPMDEVKRRKIVIRNARGVYSIPMAEFVIGAVLQVYKRFDIFREQQKERRWEKRRDLRELNGKIVVIVGCGSVGKECAKRFKAFQTRVIGVDVVVKEDDCFEKIVELENLSNMLHIADVVVLTVPLTDHTRNLIGKEELAFMKKDGILVNISRGGVLNSEAASLSDKTLILDVFEDEPLDERSYLWKKEIITPHNSFIGEGNNKRLDEIIMNNLSKEE